MKKEIPQQPLAFGLFESRRHVRWMVLALLGSVLAEILSTSIAYVFRGVVDSATAFSQGGISDSRVLFWVALYPAVIFSESILWRASGFMGMRWVTGFKATAHMTLFAYLTGHSHTFFTNRFAGALANKIGHAIDGVGRIIESLVWNYLPTLLSFVLSIIFAWLASPILAGIFLFWLVLALPVNFLLARRVARFTFHESKQHSKLRGIVVDVLTNMNAVQQYARRSGEQQFVGGETEKLRKAELKSWVNSELMLLVNSIVFVSLFAVSVVTAAFLLWQRGSISLGDFIMTMTLINSLLSSITFLGTSMKNFSQQYGNAKEGLEEILKPQDIVDQAGAGALRIAEGRIDFDAIDFAYSGQRVFDQFTLSIAGGERIGLVGPSGSGKTTFVSLLLRQQDVQAGAVRIDGQDIKAVTLDSLRSAIAAVPQDPLLFHRTLRENIAYGKPDATQQEIEEAAQRAQAHEFIKDLPEGYETLVGERGVKLSGGQRQRVAIARAILKNAPILVLDEATSSLDSESEVAIQRALAELMKGKTVIAIAHRLSTIRAMDRIIVLEKGQITEEGKHDALVQNGQTYARLWSHQAGGFLQEE